MLADLRDVGVTGTDAEARCEPRRHHAEQERHPLRPAAAGRGAGIRLGTPAVTTQGMAETDMKEVAGLFAPRGPGRGRIRRSGHRAPGSARWSPRQPAYPRP